MSVYKTYARKLDEAFRTARDEYARLVSAVHEAQNARDRLAAHSYEMSREDYARKSTMANLAVDDATANLLSGAPKIWQEFREERARIRSELEAASRNANLVTPDAIDANGLELLKSGIMGPDDMQSMAARYDGNPTMLRLIGKYARENAAQIAEKDPRSAAMLNVIARDVSDGKSKDLRRFDDLISISDHCGASERRSVLMNPSVVVAMGKHWEDLTASALDE